MTDNLYRAWAYLTHGRTFAVVLGFAFAILAIGLFVASRTRWGKTKLLTKCIVLSVLAHVWLLMYAYGTRVILPQGDPSGKQAAMSVVMDSSEFPAPQPSEPEELVSEPAPWEQPLAEAKLPEVAQPSPSIENLLSAVSAPKLLEDFRPMPMPPLPEMPVGNQGAETVPVLPPSESTARNVVTPRDEDPAMPRPLREPPRPSSPEEYQLRQAENRLQLASMYGADADSEAAVNASLKWLASVQMPDGSWNAKKYGGGTETRALGEHRHSTGDRADTGVSGLALLAFLSAGHTHLSGDYRDTMARGLGYLVRSQGPESGDLSGPKQIGSEPSVLNARMYCHGIATLALAEAYAMTHDVQLKQPLIKAAEFTKGAQDKRGGWRYVPGASGDLSQFGWQAMALHSMERSGIQIPTEVKQRMQYFLESCLAGQAGGLARYRPGEGRPTETMTAEALACRALLGYPLSNEAKAEAKSLIMQHLPGTEQDNIYFCYYATLALFQLQDQDWSRWNQALKARLLQSQVPPYRDQAGSWDPDALWGGYGGRVYSTAMSCLCLEVYYRYLPMYQPQNLARQPWTTVPR